MKQPFLKNIALEEAGEGKTVAERERTFYGCFDTGFFGSLKDCPSEEHEQWEVRIPKSDDNRNGGRVRVRLTAANGAKQYVQTIKINEAGSAVGNTQVAETSFEVTEDVYTQFKLLATAGMHKFRREWTGEKDGQKTMLHIDFFPMGDGKLCNWCKIDYEYGPNDPDMPAFPPGLTEIIPGDTSDPEEKAFIRSLYGDVFLLKNTGPAQEAVPISE